MKAILIFLITVCFLMSFGSLTAADVLRVEPEISCDNLRIEGGNLNYSISKPILRMGMHSETDLRFLRVGIDLGFGKAQNFSYLTVTPRAGWEFGIRDYKIKIYEGYRVYRLHDFTSQAQVYDYAGFIFGTDIESKISEMFALTGSLTIPETCAYSHNGEVITDGSSATDSISQSDWRIGLKFTLLPLYDILIAYHATEIFDNNQNFKIAAKGISASLNITY